MKKIVYIGMKYDYGDEKRSPSYDYIHIFQSLDKAGHECHFFDYMDYIKVHGFEKLQTALISFVEKHGPDLVIFSLYTDQISEKTVAAISERTTTFGLFFDDTWRRDFVSKFGNEMHYFTTTDPYGETIYKKLGIKGKALYFSYGFNPEHFFPDRKNLTKDITFVGSWSTSREWVLKHLQKAGLPVEFYGHGWKNGVLSKEKMVEIFQTSKISLNLSNSVQDNVSYVLSSLRAFKSYFVGAKRGEQLKGRHVEINACGGFQISFYADGLTGLYEVGKEIEIYQSVPDLIAKLKFYLEYEEERELIARKGWERSQSYKYAEVMQKLFLRMGK